MVFSSGILSGFTMLLKDFMEFRKGLCKGVLAFCRVVCGFMGFLWAF